MDIKETAQILTILSANYPHYYKKLTKNEASVVINTWQKAFSDVPAVLVFEALQKAINFSKFPPTIAEVVTELERMYFSFLCLENDMSISQEERSEAKRITQLLYDLGFADKGRRNKNSVIEFLKLGGINSLGIEAHNG